jgi:hypothetical protein
MKKILIGLVVLMFALASCTKENPESAGSIPGMGDAEGNLEINAPFILPEGITLVGDITGLDNSGTKGSAAKSSGTSCFGSGGRMIKLKLTCLNTTNKRKTLFFPKGLLWKCKEKGYQDALLCQTTWCTMEANSQRTILIDLYCINFGRDPSDHLSSYQILGVTSSRTIWSLLNLIRWRKINFEHWYNPSKGEDGPTYDLITERVQDIVWNLTNKGIDVTEEDIAFIESIPELDPEEIPAVDSDSQFPEYFDEYVVTGK